MEVSTKIKVEAPTGKFLKLSVINSTLPHPTSEMDSLKTIRADPDNAEARFRTPSTTSQTS